MLKSYAVALCLVLLCGVEIACAQAIPAFSGADGAAAYASGGRGGIVYHVTSINSAIDDPARNDFGSLRYGLNNANFPAGVPRTIVFDVGGVFSLGRLSQAGWDTNGNGWDAQSRLTIGGTNITFAGQTAPGAGVIFMGGGLKPQGNNNIIRNITVASGYGMRNWWQPGEAFPAQPVAGDTGVGNFPDATVFDAMDIAGTNIMIDHVSTLYATDETISMNEVANNITVQYSNISQGQNYPQWDAEGGGYTGHALGSLLEAGSQAKISFHHNLYAHQKSRMPQTQGGGSGAYYDFRNNVFYNWLGTAGSRSGTTFWNLASNFYLAGDGGDNPAGGNSVAMNQSSGGTGVIGTNSNIYRNGNILDSNKDADANDGVALSNSGAANPLWRVACQLIQGPPIRQRLPSSGSSTTWGPIGGHAMM
jgi:pectate lyase